MTLILLEIHLLLAAIGFSLAANATRAENRASILHHRLNQRLSSIHATKAISGLESVLGVMGPLALAAMVSLPFVAPAAAALLPLASITGVFGRRRRHIEDPRRPLPNLDVLMRKLHAVSRSAS